MEEKPEFDLSSLKQEQGQNNSQDNMSNRVVKPEQQTPAPQTKPDSAKPDTKIADAEINLAKLQLIHKLNNQHKKHKHHL